MKIITYFSKFLTWKILSIFGFTISVFAYSDKVSELNSQYPMLMDSNSGQYINLDTSRPQYFIPENQSSPEYNNKSLLHLNLEKRINLDDDSGYGSESEVRKKSKAIKELLSSAKKSALKTQKKPIPVPRPICPWSEPFSQNLQGDGKESDVQIPEFERNFYNCIGKSMGTVSEHEGITDFSFNFQKDFEISGSEGPEQQEFEEKPIMIFPGYADKTETKNEIEDPLKNGFDDQKMESKASLNYSVINSPTFPKELLKELEAFIFPESRNEQNEFNIGDQKSLEINELKESKQQLLDFGKADWKSVGFKKDTVDDFGGLDDYFISSKTKIGNLAFGITDASELKGMGFVSKSLSAKMCVFAQTVYESHQIEPDLSPVKIMNKCYRSVLADPAVSPGAASALFGTLYEDGKLKLSYTGTPWASVFRNGNFVYETRLRSDAEDQKYQFTKMPFLVKHKGTKNLADHHTKVLGLIEQDTWVLEKGDIILAATNGLYKRMSSKQIQKSLGIYMARDFDMNTSAFKLVETAIGMPQIDLKGKSFKVESYEKKEDIVVILIKIL